MMSGMLVPVQPVEKAMRAVETLFGVDPEFVTLCKTLYGSDVDPVEVWCDVFGKDEPGGSDMHVPGTLQVDQRFRRRRRVRKTDSRRRALEAAGIGATVIGGALGVRELGNSLEELGKPGLKRVATKTGALIPAQVKAAVKNPKTRASAVGGMLAGDAAATANQAIATRQRKRTADGVAKIGVSTLANGFEAGMRKLPGIGGLAPKMKAAAGAATATPGRKLATAATGGALAGAGVNRTMNKRAEEEDLDVVWAGEFEKFDEDKRLVFGWASVVEVNGSPVVDKQGDYIHPDDLENASYEYVIKSRVGGDMHSRDGDIPLKVSDLVESVVVTPEKLRHMGIPDHVAKSMPVGWWVGFKVHSDKHWDMVKKRARGGFSIHGRGKRVAMSMDSLMPGYH